MPRKYTTAERELAFAARCMPEPNSGCLLWLGHTCAGGYGRFSNGVRMELAHRYALRAAGVALGADQDVRHTCDTPCCVEITHLAAGTTQENIDDMWIKRRATKTKKHGSNNKMAKLSAGEVELIRGQPTVSLSTLAKSFGVAKMTIWRIRAGVSWRCNVVETVRRCGRD